MDLQSAVTPEDTDQIGVLKPTNLNLSVHALNRAAEEGHNDAVRYLLTHGISPVALGKEQWTPLHRAAWKTHVDVIELLLEHGCSPDNRDAKFLTPLDQLGCMAHLSSMFKAADAVDLRAKNDVLFRAARLLIEKMSPSNISAEIIYRLICQAAMYGNEPLIRFLLARESHSETVSVGSSPLFRPALLNAALYGQIGIVRLLLDAIGDSPEVSSLRPFLLRTAVQGFCQPDTPYAPNRQANCKALFSQLMKEGVDIDGTGGSGRTALYYAVEGNALSLIAPLLRAGANPFQQDRTYRTPFLMAASEGHIVCLQTILTFTRPVLPEGTPYWPVLEAAVRWGNLAGIHMLLATGSYGDLTQHHLSLLHAAVDSDKPEVVDLLAAHGIMANVPGPRGRQPLLHSAARSGKHLMCEALLKARAAINQTDRQGRTPLYIAAQFGKKRVLTLLLARGADPRLPNSKGITPTMMAQTKGKTAIADQIRAAGG